MSLAVAVGAIWVWSLMVVLMLYVISLTGL
jgi:hypothetical protein